MVQSPIRIWVVGGNEDQKAKAKEGIALFIDSLPASTELEISEFELPEAAWKELYKDLAGSGTFPTLVLILYMEGFFNEKTISEDAYLYSLSRRCYFSHVPALLIYEKGVVMHDTKLEQGTFSFPDDSLYDPQLLCFRIMQRLLRDYFDRS